MCKYLKVINQVNRPLHQICFLFLPWQLRLRKTSRPHLNWDPQSPRALCGAWRWKTLASGFWCIICLWVSPPPDSSQLWGASQSMHRCKHEFCRSEFCPLCNGHLLRTKSAYISEMVHLWGEYPKEDAHHLPEMGRKIKTPKSKYSKCNLEGGS